MAETFSQFDAADYLTTPEDIAAYLNASAEEGDPAAMAAALGAVARAQKRRSRSMRLVRVALRVDGDLQLPRNRNANELMLSADTGTDGVRCV